MPSSRTEGLLSRSVGALFFLPAAGFAWAAGAAWAVGFAWAAGAAWANRARRRFGAPPPLASESESEGDDDDDARALLYAWTDLEHPRPLAVPGRAAAVRSVAAGGEDAVALLDDGRCCHLGRGPGREPNVAAPSRCVDRPVGILARVTRGWFPS